MWSFVASIALLAHVASAGPLTVVVEPRSTACFYEEVAKAGEGERLVEVFVTEGGSLDIGLQVRGPFAAGADGLPDLSPRHPPELDHSETIRPDSEIMADEFGDSFTYKFTAVQGLYEVCLVNGGTFMSTRKLVELDVRRARDEADEPARGVAALLKEAIKESKVQPTVVPTTERPAAKVNGTAAGNATVGARPEGLKLDEVDITHLAASMGKLSAYFTDIRAKQARERKRLALQSSITQNSHNDMVVGSLVETVVFIAASIFQIFFVRRWFHGKGRRQWA